MDSNIFASLLSEEEWQKVPATIGKKISRFVNEKIEELLTSRALSETKKDNLEKENAELKQQNETLINENAALKARLEAAGVSISELEKQVSSLSSELMRLQAQANQFEAEAAEYRHQRNLAVDERDEFQKKLQRKETEVERLQLDNDTLTKQLGEAVTAKCEALAKINEVDSLKMTLEYKEKRLDQERTLKEGQIHNLSLELQQRTDELLNMRRDNSSRCIQLENKLCEISQDLSIANEQIKSLTELNTHMSERNEELSQKILKLNESQMKMNESYVCEIDAKTKMANAYKNMYDDCQKHADELKEALNEVQDLLKQATEQYGALETQSKEMELSNEEVVAKKNHCISMLTKELETANELIEQLKNESTRDIEAMSTSAASISKMMKPSFSYTELYSRYVSANEQVTTKDAEIERLNNYITCIIKEIEERGPVIKQLRDDYSDVLDANETLKAANDALLSEIEQMRETYSEYRRIESGLTRENERLKKERSDLSRQVVHLLREVELSRIGSSSLSTDNDSISSADISKRLVTFSDIGELQENNQKLLALVRELTARQEEAESLDPAAIARLQRKLEELQESQSELLEEREQQTKMMVTLRNQREMYKNLYTQSSRGGSGGKGGGDAPLPMETAQDNDDISKAQSEAGGSNVQSDEKVQELEGQIEKLKTTIKHMKDDYDKYRTEKAEHEKILLEQVEAMRKENNELTKINFKLTSQAEYNAEMIKTMQNNTQIYKKQIAALEKQNRVYSESISKHEQAASYLKDDALQNQTKAAKAEVMLANIQKENALLQEAEKRLTKECDMLRQHVHQQTVLSSNIELIKATLERNDAESKLRLEAKLDEAHLECSSLRRRLEEEQRNFKELSEHLEKQFKHAQDRMEEERGEAEKLRKELAQNREELANKTAHLEDLSKKLKSSVFAIPDASVEGRKLRELEQQFSDAQAEINSLKTRLNASKGAAEEYFNVAQTAEKRLTELAEEQKAYKEQIEGQARTIKELQEKCGELQGELSIQMDDQDVANVSVAKKSQQLEEELNVKKLDLRTAIEQLEAARVDIKSLNEQLKASENKYAREVALHSADLQSLVDLKIELDKARDEINSVQAERDQALEKVKQNLDSMEKQQELLSREKEELRERFKQTDENNSMLLDQIQHLNSQLTILQAQVSADNQRGNQSSHNTSVGDMSMNRSLAEEDVHNSEQLLKIIKYLRQEKDIAVSKADIIEAEHFRLKSQFEVVSQQLEETKAQIEAERQKSEASVISSAKHAELLRNLEKLNAITDSNRVLREERGQLMQELTELRARTEKLESEIVPLQEQNMELTAKADQMQTENISLRGECTRWRQRANQLIEKTNRTSPEDWKKLQTERETLAKQLTVERGNNAKLVDANNTLKQTVQKLEEEIKSLRAENNRNAEEISKLKDHVTSLQTQVSQLSGSLEQQNQNNSKLTDDNKILTEEIASRDNSIAELKNNLSQLKKIAKKYKTQYEDQAKDIESLKQQNEQTQVEQNQSVEKQTQLIEQQRTEHEERITQLESSHKEAVEQLNQQVTNGQDQIDGLKREIEALKQASQEKEEKFKSLFKSAKDRIVSLTEKNNSLKEELEKGGGGGGSGVREHPSAENNSSTNNAELVERINALQQERDSLVEKLQDEKEARDSEVDFLNHRISQLERKLGQQQGSKPSTSSAASEKSSVERPTADIKPIPGHSTNTQTQSVPIQPWRSGGEPPLASIRPMSQQLRTAAVLPTTQTPSAVMVPPQQQVHTTGSSSIEALSSSPTSSHTEYVPATSSASSMLGPRQVAVPPTQSSEDDESSGGGMQVQATPQQQTLAVVSPRIEPPSSGSAAQEQGTSSSSSNTVTTTQASLKRQREPDTDSCQAEEMTPTNQQTKRTRLQQGATVSDSGLEVEYQVPTSSQRDQDDDNVIVVESDEEVGPDEGEGDDQDEPDDTEVYDMESLEQDNYEDVDCQEVEVEEEGGNEVDVIDDSSEVMNQSESQEDAEGEGVEQQAQSQAISSGTDATAGPSSSIFQPSTSGTSFPRQRLIAPLPYRMSGILDEGCMDDGIVPSTPTLFAPRRSDSYGETVSSPHVPTSAVGRFTFNESQVPSSGSPSALETTGRSVGGMAATGGEAASDQRLEVPHGLPSGSGDDNSTGRSVPTTPLQSSPQESIPNVIEEQGDRQTTQSDAEIPQIIVSADDDEGRGEGSSEEVMGPPTQAGTSSEETRQEENEGEDGVSSEGEKQPSTEEGEEEGREAEASQSPIEPRRSARGATPSRRPARSIPARVTRMGPTPIVWADQRQLRQPHQDRGRGLGRLGEGSNRASPRRGRSRGQRPYSGRF